VLLHAKGQAVDGNGSVASVAVVDHRWPIVGGHAPHIGLDFYLRA
jgi:hypothetical protein